MYRYAKNDEIEIRVDLEKDNSQIEYKNYNDEDSKWQGTPFQRADVQTENEALNLVMAWLPDSI